MPYNLGSYNYKLRRNESITYNLSVNEHSLQFESALEKHSLLHFIVCRYDYKYYEACNRKRLIQHFVHSKQFRHLRLVNCWQCWVRILLNLKLQIDNKFYMQIKWSQIAFLLRIFITCTVDEAVYMLTNITWHNLYLLFLYDILMILELMIDNIMDKQSHGLTNINRFQIHFVSRTIPQVNSNYCLISFSTFTSRSLFFW